MDSLARAREVWDKIIHSSDCWDDEDPSAPEAKIEGIAQCIAAAIDEARLEEHIKAGHLVGCPFCAQYSAKLQELGIADPTLAASLRERGKV